MAIPWRAAIGGFFDGYGAFFLMFRKTVPVPGSESMEEARRMDSEMLAKYGASSPEWVDAFLKIRENTLDLDRKYTRMVRIVGAIELTAILVAVCFLAFHKRF
jgi:hypothetical protein